MTRVVKPDQLGKPVERLREQIKKLELSTGEGEVMLPCIFVHVLTYMYVHISHTFRGRSRIIESWGGRGGRGGAGIRQ